MNKEDIWEPAGEESVWSGYTEFSDLKPGSQYSETYGIAESGKFADIRPDGISRFLDVKTPEELYAYAQELSQKDPELLFSFHVDPEGRLFTYTVKRGSPH